MTWLVLLAAVGAAIYLFARSGNASTQAAIEGVVDRLVAGALAKEAAVPAEKVLALLSSPPPVQPDPGVIAAIDALKPQVSVMFQRDDAKTTILKVTIQTARTKTVSEQQLEWDALPDEVRAEFLKGGRKELACPWSLPWQRRQA